MSFLLWGRGAVDVDPAEPRSTVTVVQADAPPSEAPHAPDINETFSDPHTEGGLTTRQVASHVIPRERYVPHIGDANEDHNAIIDRQISTSGTAAAREAAGEWGHGTLQITEGIEPAIGEPYGGDYFVAERPEFPASQMSPAAATDPATNAAAQAGAVENARAAVQGSLYDALYAARMTGL